MKGVVSVLLFALLGVVLYLLLWPVSIDPAAWQPPPPPVDDPRFAENQRLAKVERITRDLGIGPEAVNLDEQGRIVTGFKDGRVMRMDADGRNPELLADTQGRPLGLDFASNGDLIVADAVRGLLKITKPGEFEVLVTEVDGVPLKFTDDVVVSRQDIAYFSDASVKYGVHEVMEDFFEHRPHGRIIATDLRSGASRVLVADLHFANGVALGPDEEYLLINETAEYRVMRYWLKGPRSGQLEVFIENLPGLPDNITFNGRDTFWLALYAPRAEALDALLPKPWLRKIVWRLPDALRPGPVKHGFVLGLNPQAEVVHNLQDPGPEAFAPITSVREGQTHLYFGSLSASSLARLPLTELATP